MIEKVGQSTLRLSLAVGDELHENVGFPFGIPLVLHQCERGLS